MADGWYCQINGKVIGPLHSAQLKQQADSGLLKSDSLVRKGESGNWVAAKQVKGLIATPQPVASNREDDDALGYIQADEPLPRSQSTSTPTSQRPPVAFESSSHNSPPRTGYSQPSTGKACPFCGEQIQYAATKCKHCGEFLDGSKSRSASQNDESEKRILPLFLLFFFLGFLGIHAFYAGRIFRGISYLIVPVIISIVLVMLPPAGIFFLLVWAVSLLSDFICILVGIYKDGKGKRITKWT